MAQSSDSDDDFTDVMVTITDNLVKDLMCRGFPLEHLLKMRRAGALYCPWTGKFVVPSKQAA